MSTVEMIHPLDVLYHVVGCFLVQVASAKFNADPYVQDFGISVDQKMVMVTGRVLPPPKLQYGGKVLCWWCD